MAGASRAAAGTLRKARGRVALTVVSKGVATAPGNRLFRVVAASNLRAAIYASLRPCKDL
jgi:hypothetical protein